MIYDINYDAKIFEKCKYINIYVNYKYPKRTLVGMRYK